MSDEIKSTIYKKGLTMKKVAEDLGISKSYLTALVKGEVKVTNKKYLALIEYFGRG